MKREARLLKSKAVDSLILAIEHFNRPWDCGRHEAVLILLDRGFELLLKASLVHRGGRIREPHAKETIGFDRCVRKCLSDEGVKCLTGEQAITIQLLNSLRDAAQHYLLDVSEQQIYIYVQAAVSIFGDLLEAVFSEELAAHMPERVVPICTSAPVDLHTTISAEFREVKRLVEPGSRRRLQAMAKLRTLAIVESSIRGIRSQPADGELQRLVKDVRSGKSWRALFPNVAALQLATDDQGINVSIRLTKREGEAVHLVREGTPGATMLAVKRVNEIDYYSLGLMGLAKKLELSGPRTLALIRHLRLQDSEDYFKIIRVSKSHFKRYSSRALDALRAALLEVDMDQVWHRHGSARGPGR